MSESWRLRVEYNDRSAVTQTSIGNVGATVIRASKGGAKPVLIPRGGTNTILSIFGKPSSTYPDVWDAIEYNKTADLWISAPYKNGTYGGVFLTKTWGSVPFVTGISDPDNINYTNHNVQRSIGTGDGSTTNFTYTIAKSSIYVNQSIDILLNGTSINVTASDADPEVLTTTPDVGNGTYNRSTGVLSFTFNSAPALNATIKASYELDFSSEAYAAIINAYPESDDTSVKVVYDSTNDWFEMNVYQTNPISGTVKESIDSPVTFSLTSGTKDGFGKNIYLASLYDSDSNLFQVDINNSTINTFTDDTTRVALSGGTRGDTLSLIELTTGWNYYQDSNKYPADIFFDNTADPGIPALFEALRETYQKYSTYLLPLPDDTVSNTITTASGYGINNRGICLYWGYAKVIDNYNASYLYSFLMGRVAGKHAAMVDIYNGGAPAWLDENGHGGQLGSGIVEMNQTATETQLQQLDAAGINPIVNDPRFGVMIKSDKTTKLPLSDYSYIPHARLTDYIVKNIIDNVLVYQFVKLNDVAHRTAAKTRADSITAGPLAAGLLTDVQNICDETNNTSEVLQNRQFILETVVQFTPYSEKVTFIFTNVDQTTTVEEYIANN